MRAEGAVRLHDIAFDMPTDVATLSARLRKSTALYRLAASDETIDRTLNTTAHNRTFLPQAALNVLTTNDATTDTTAHTLNRFQVAAGDTSEATEPAIDTMFHTSGPRWLLRWFGFEKDRCHVW